MLILSNQENGINDFRSDLINQEHGLNVFSSGISVSKNYSTPWVK